jgi:hypothetical protein
MKEELTSQIAALSSHVDSRLAAMEAKLEQRRLDKQQFVFCEELMLLDDKLTANATSSGWPMMQQQCHQPDDCLDHVNIFGQCDYWLTMQLQCHQ